MNFKPIIIVCGEPNSVFSELLAKSFKKYKNKNPIVVIGSYNLINDQLKQLKLRLNLNLINFENNIFKNIKDNKINIININYNFVKAFEPISSKSNRYISACFKKAFDIIKTNNISGLINGPISKKFFLKGKYPGVTEYISRKFKIANNFAMLIYNKNLSVCPITTHLPLQRVNKQLNKSILIKKTSIINKFYKDRFYKKPIIAMTGLNPHCENFFNKSEEQKIIKPAINFLKKRKIKIFGPYPSDTIFLKQNLKKFDIVIGMYHDQVLSPIKAIYGFDAINITLGLPFLRVSPDHGPNYEMVGKNKSNPQSLVNSIKFLDR